MRATILKTFSINTPVHQKSLEIIEKWKKDGANVSDYINRAIVIYEALLDKEGAYKEALQ